MSPSAITGAEKTPDCSPRETRDSPAGKDVDPDRSTMDLQDWPVPEVYGAKGFQIPVSEKRWGPQRPGGSPHGGTFGTVIFININILRGRGAPKK